MLTAIQKKHWHMCSVTHTHRLLPSHAFVLTESISLSPHPLSPTHTHIHKHKHTHSSATVVEAQSANAGQERLPGDTG